MARRMLLPEELNKYRHFLCLTLEGYSNGNDTMNTFQVYAEIIDANKNDLTLADINSYISKQKLIVQGATFCDESLIIAKGLSSSGLWFDELDITNYVNVAGNDNQGTFSIALQQTNKI